MNSRKRPHGEHGAVSVYFMVVLSALLLFQALLLDLARLHAAKHRAQQAVDAAMRSVYAGFDPDLQKYGLYGVDVGEAAEEAFRRVLTRNLQSPGIRTARGEWITLEADESENGLRHYDRLSDPDVFRYQILEEMKIRAPIEYALQVIDLWRDTETLEETRQTGVLSRRMQKIEQLLLQRNERLEHAGVLLASIAGGGGLAAVWHADNRQVHQQLDSLADEIRDRTLEALQAELSELEAELRELQTRLHVTDAQGDQASAPSDRGTGQISDSDPESGSVDSEKRKLEADIENVEAEIDAINRLLDAIAEYAGLVVQHDRELQVREQELQDAAERVKQWLAEARELNRQAAEEAGRLNPELRAAVRLHDDAEYDSWMSGISELTARYAAYGIQFDPAQLLTGRDFHQRQDRLNRMNDAFRDQAVTLHSEYSAWLGQLRAVEEDLARRRDAERTSAGNSIAQAMNLAAGCSNNGVQAYAMLAERFGRYAAGAAGSNDAGSGTGQDGQSEENAGELLQNREVDAVIAEAFNLAERMQTVLLAVRDRAYLIEYALTKFNYRTMDTGSGELSNPAGHVLPQQEAEYILYGWNSCTMNHSSAFAEMFMLRLAVRTTEQLLSPDQSLLGLGSPWLLFLRAAADGAASAWKDMQRLVSGEAVEISSRLPKALAMNYKDYLRLFMVLHGNEARMMARMQALVDLNTGVDLSERAALSEAQAVVLFRPWILPAFPGWLGASARDGKLVIRVRSAQAY